MPVEVIFAVLSGMTLVGAGIAVGVPNLFRAALGLMLSLVGVAGLFMLQQAQFLAVVQLLVYVGGVSVLIVFAIMLTERGVAPLQISLNPRLAVWAALVGGGLAAVLMLVIWRAPLSATAVTVSAEEIGMSLLNRFLIPFEAVSLLLLVALIGAVLIAKGGLDEVEKPPPPA